MVNKGRPKTFDNYEALEKAQALFWENGYEATSLNELILKMGISRQSLYNTFGNKHDLFIKCLEYYIHEGYKSMKALFESEQHAQDKLNQLISMMNGYFAGPKAKGCFVSFTIQEMAQKDNDVKRLLDKKNSKNFELYFKLFEISLEQQQMKSALSARDLADLLDGIMLSATSLCKLPNRGEQIKNLFTIFLKQIEFIK
jgi:TetR/AcrR family transcriptional repressor of nem operon